MRRSSFLSFAIAVTIVLAICPARARNADFFESIAGRYEGDLRGGNGIEPVTTFLEAVPPSSLRGNYIFVEPGNRRTAGELTDCQSAMPLEVSCRWHDRYGSGYVVFSFAADLLSFRGQWSSQSQSRPLPWNGVRKQ